MRRLYRLILHAYPYDYRLWFAQEMLAAFEQALSEGHGLREVAGTAARCPIEWFAKIRTDPATRGRALPDVRMMRPVGVTRQVWFGRSTCSSDTSR
jgi:hypothetical protein